MRKVKDARTNYAVDAKRYTPAEYLARERAAAFKSEYYDGEIVMMAGGTGNHSIVSGNVHTLLNNALEPKPCVVFNSDMRLQLARKQSYVYPDVMVVCGKIEYVEGRNDTIVNPIVIVEVLSPSTYRQDFTRKFALYNNTLAKVPQISNLRYQIQLCFQNWRRYCYKQLDSLQAYIMVDSEQVHTWCIERDADGKMWHVEISNKLREYVRITALDCALSLRRIYAKVQFDEPVK